MSVSVRRDGGQQGWGATGKGQRGTGQEVEPVKPVFPGGGQGPITKCSTDVKKSHRLQFLSLK